MNKDTAVERHGLGAPVRKYVYVAGQPLALIDRGGVAVGGEPVVVDDTDVGFSVTGTWPASTVLLAMGFVHPVHAGMIADLGVALDAQGNVEADTVSYRTSVDGVFAIVPRTRCSTRSWSNTGRVFRRRRRAGREPTGLRAGGVRRLSSLWTPRRGLRTRQVRPVSVRASDRVQFAKLRGFCPSCGARRMAESAARLVDHVLPRVPIRQWVVSFPWPRALWFIHHITAFRSGVIVWT